jgi:hypothetical protein
MSHAPSATRVATRWTARKADMPRTILPLPPAALRREFLDHTTWYGNSYTMSRVLDLAGGRKITYIITRDPDQGFRTACRYNWGPNKGHTVFLNSEDGERHEAWWSVAAQIAFDHAKIAIMRFDLPKEGEEIEVEDDTPIGTLRRWLHLASEDDES